MKEDDETEKIEWEELIEALHWENQNQENNWERWFAWTSKQWLSSLPLNSPEPFKHRFLQAIYKQILEK